MLNTIFLGMVMSTIKDKSLKLKQDINSVGSSLPMNYINLDFIQKMELEKKENQSFKEALIQIEKLTDKALQNIEDYSSIIEIKNIYSEAYILSKLQALLHINKIPELTTKTPDYIVRFRDEDIYIELKSLNMLGGTLKHKEIMNDTMESKIEVEDQIKQGSKVGLAEHVIQPYSTYSNKNYNSGSIKLVIESLIDKINQNIKSDQYALGDTILLVDLADQLPLLSIPSDAIQKEYFDDMSGKYVSGELWNVAFGKVGDQIFKPAEFEGADNDDGKLSKDGILISHPYIKGLIFHANKEFYSIAEITKSNGNVIECLKYISKQHSFKLS